MDFESRLFVKPDAAKLLHAALSRPGYECAPIAMGTNTDPYQPIEERWRITRSVIELLLETRHPFTITTKSDRVLRDLDLLVPAAKLGIASVAISVTSLDPAIARTLEPRAPSARKRLAAIKALNDAGVPAYVAIAPVVPQITDHELEAYRRGGGRGRARAAASICRCACRTRSRPCSAPGSTSIIPTARPRSWRRSSSLRGGRDNDPNFFSRMRGQGPWADLLRTRFEKAAKRYGLAQCQVPAAPRPVPAARGRADALALDDSTNGR